MEDKFSRSIRYAAEFYLSRLSLILLFSLPFVFAFLIPVLVPAPTYLALGGVFLRTGSLPELSILDVVITAVAYAFAVFIFVDTLVNINIVVRSKRTLTTIKHEVTAALGTYAARIFFITTAMLLVFFAAQIMTYENDFQSIIYPLLCFVIAFLLFFVAPATVIDNLDVPTAVGKSSAMAIRNPHFVVGWGIIGLVLVSFTQLIAQLFLSSPYSGYFVLLVNSLLILPYLTILQTQMYMEKYPLAR